MALQIVPISLPLPFKFAEVNCYLVKTESGFILIDCGYANTRKKLDATLDNLGCQPGNLKLILLTHGDFDHTGNAKYLRDRFNSRIAMHAGDDGMLEYGDMFWNRKIEGSLLKKLMSSIIRFGEKERTRPDILLSDGASLAEYGLDAQVLNTPGHSSGSICILTSSGELFCGDLFTSSTGKAMLNSMMYDKEAGHASFDRLKDFPIKTVYPGHGVAFPWEELFVKTK